MADNAESGKKLYIPRKKVTFMERKVNVRRQGPASPRGERLEDEEVFDYPGLEDESNGSGPVSRDAHVALRKAFENLKKRFLEGQERISELQAQLKQRDKRGSHERVYQERDELLGHLQKSYLAFKEKYGENEELKKMVEDLKQSLKLCQEASAQSEGGAQPESSSEEKRKLGEKKYITIIEELKTVGLEVVEDNDQLFIILTDRDNLKKWIEEKADGNITLAIKGSTSEDKATETELMLTQQEGYEQTEGKRKRVEAEVILLRQKIQDQAQELNRFYKVFKEVMSQNKILRQREQSKENDGGNTKGLSTLKQETPAKRATAQEIAVFHKKADTILSTAQEQTAEMRQVKEHLDQQNKSLRTLMDITDKTTQDFERLVNAPRIIQDVPDYPKGRSSRWAEEGATSLPQGQRNAEEGNFEHAFEDDAPLSIPVQESYLHRAKRSGETGGTTRLAGERNVAPSSAVSSRAPEGRAVSMTTFLSENTCTGESDIEVIEEEEDFIGATPSRGKICPVCERFFPDSYGQKEFELHVEQHFADDA